MKKCVWIIGASRGLGRQVAEKHAAAGDDVVVSSRNANDLVHLCAHLEIAYGVRVESLEVSYEKITSLELAHQSIEQLKALGVWPELVYFMAGSNDEQDTGLSAAAVLSVILHNNFTAPVFLLNEYVRASKNKQVRIVVASSVAAARPRGKNIAYGTAKGALENYCFGLMHALTDHAVTIQVIRFGYMNTRLSVGQKLPFKPANVSRIAKQLLRLEQKKSGLYYLPKFWFFITLALLSTPFFIFKKLKF
jgi:NAD(P)-dependent dehydrogenase (short-subunit alcohol dehydrogenase family)